MADFSKGDRVEWNWGSGTGTGTVKERFTSRVERTIKGSKITRDASQDEPAYLVEQEDGDQALKSGSELKKASGGSSGSSNASSGSSGGNKLEDRSKDELYEKAKNKDIDGRSDMDKGELADAIRKAS